MLTNLQKYKILLASKSPRRHELLSQLRVPFTVVTRSGIDESYPHDLKAEDVALYISSKKAEAYREMLHSNELIITADTIVICDDKVLGKPHNRNEACDMLRLLSGKTHKVITGVSIITEKKESRFSSETLVSFADLSDEDIEYYVDNFQPFDKAGAYGIQEWIGCVAIREIRGSFYNVMGLPVHKLYSELQSF